MFILNNKFYKKSVFFLVLVILSLSIFSQIASASSLDDAKKGLFDSALKGYSGQIPFVESGKDVSPAVIIGRVVGALLSFVGVLFFILMIYGGLLWMTARGNTQQVDKAKDLIIAAVIGLVIIFAAYAITSLIGQAITAGEPTT